MNQSTADFIRRHAGDDVRQLALRGTKDPEVDLTLALDQIAGRQTARRKLPTWADMEGLVYPPHLAMEQCSSELTARYKARLCDADNSRPRTLVDLTGGFGVDFSFMAQHFAEAVYVERQQPLCDIARHNFQLLGLTQATVVCGDGVDYLQQMAPADVVYIDPARRDSHGARTYGINDCTPDVLALLPLLVRKAHCVLLKLSPMLDWRKTVSDLGDDLVSEVHIVAVGNECKELLVKMNCEKNEREKVEDGKDEKGEKAKDEKGEKAQPLRVVCVNILSDGTEDRFDSSLFPLPSSLPKDSSFFTLPSSLPKDSSLSTFPSSLFPFPFLLVPNAAIMKAGCFTELAQHFGLQPIAANSHLFVADHPVERFPGRMFRIKAVSTMNKRDLRQHLGTLTQANITVRNFPLSVADLRRRLKLGDGGDTYIFATTLASGEHVLLITEAVARSV